MGALVLCFQGLAFPGAPGSVYSERTHARICSGHQCALGVNQGDMAHGAPQGPRKRRPDRLPCPEPLAPNPASPGHLAADVLGRSVAICTPSGGEALGAGHSAFLEGALYPGTCGRSSDVTRGFRFSFEKGEKGKSRRKPCQCLVDSGEWAGASRGEAGCGRPHAKRFISSVFIISCSPLKSNVLGAFVFNTHLTLPT